MNRPEPSDVDPDGIMSLTEYDIAVKRQMPKIETVDPNSADSPPKLAGGCRQSSIKESETQ